MNFDFPERRSVLIFDWDDTICPSSFVDQWKIDNFEELPVPVSDERIVDDQVVSNVSKNEGEDRGCLGLHVQPVAP
jgi:hypothetical protein